MKKNLICLILVAAFFLASCLNRKSELFKKITQDEEGFVTRQLNHSTIDSCLDLIDIEYNKSLVEHYEEVIRTLQNHRYYGTASFMFSQINQSEHPPAELASIHMIMGQVELSQSEIKKAIDHFNIAHRLHPEFPNYKGYNDLHFYNYMCIAYLVEGNCEMTTFYYDSLVLASDLYPDSLFYIGGEIRLRHVSDQLRVICDSNN